MKMPVLFVGHGSPMNAIETNDFSAQWKAIGRGIGKPEAILMVSAHWYTDGVRSSDLDLPEMIYDMYGFPTALYELKYPVKGSKVLYESIKALLGSDLILDVSWGIDHGTWSVLNHMYPLADVPVVQLSIDRNLSPMAHYELGMRLKPLREKGILIMGSGNVVHNLGLVQWHMAEGFSWAQEFDTYIKNNILEKKHENVVAYERAGESHKKAFYTLEHFLPLLYVLGASDAQDSVSVFNDRCIMGSMSMTGYLFETT